MEKVINESLIENSNHGNNKVNYYIITGTSKGLGEEIGFQLLNENNYLFCISRNKNELLENKARELNSKLVYIEYDLGNLDGLDELVKKIFDNIDISRLSSICLINNAGMLDPIKTIENCEIDEITKIINVNTIAPMILSSKFIKLTKDFNCKKQIINISSGAGKNPYYGWSCYCSSKSAIDMFTKCVGVEQSRVENSVKIVSFSPGIIETDMQIQIRESKAEDFEQVDRFKKLYEEGKLQDVGSVANKIIKLIDNDNIVTGSLVDIKEL